MKRELRLIVRCCSEECDQIRMRARGLRQSGLVVSPRDVYLLLQQHPQECRICGATDNIVIDHCHVGRSFRGFLCSNCNTGLGMFGDDIGRLQRAIAYLEDSGESANRTG